MLVISGGQTGVDRIALEVAREVGLPTGGMAPKNWWTENGSDPSLKEFGLVEAPIWGYSYRTRFNALNSDGTVLFGNLTSSGSMQTLAILIDAKKLYIKNPEPQELYEWLITNEIEKLNVAGNRGTKLSEWKAKDVRDTLFKTFSLIRY